MHLLFLLLFSCYAPLVGNQGVGNQEKIILVSVPAYVHIVQEIVGEKAIVYSVVPAGVSFHTFEPSPKHIQTILSAAVWFTIGDPFEERILKKISSSSHNIQVVDLRTDIATLHNSCAHSGTDPHIWLSPRLMKKQIETMTRELEKIDIQANSKEVLLKIDSLIKLVDNLLSKAHNGCIVVAHGAFAYLCHDYDIEQLSIEHEGKEATFASLTSLIEKASQKGVKTVFSLKQYPKKGINYVAHILGARTVELDPYAENYFEMMENIAKSFQEAIQEEHEKQTNN